MNQDPQFAEYIRQQQERHRAASRNQPPPPAPQRTAVPPPATAPPPPPAAPVYAPAKPATAPPPPSAPLPPSQTPVPPPGSAFRPLTDAEQDEVLARQLQEEEDAKFNQQMTADEEIARKLQYNDENEVRAPIDVHREERMVEPLPPNQGPYQGYPGAPYGFPQPTTNYNAAPNQPLLTNQQGSGPPAGENTFCFGLGDANRKTCGISTPYVVLGVAALMVIGIIVAMVLLS